MILGVVGSVRWSGEVDIEGDISSLLQFDQDSKAAFFFGGSFSTLVGEKVRTIDGGVGIDGGVLFENAGIF